MKKVEFLRKCWPAALAVVFSGCDTTESTLGGAALGTAAGLGVGHALGGKGGAAAGAVVGGLGGAALGHHVGREGDELHRLQREVELERLKNEKLKQELELEHLRQEQRSFGR
jgi:uncharacterized protein YcfJ